MQYIRTGGLGWLDMLLLKRKSSILIVTVIKVTGKIRGTLITINEYFFKKIGNSNIGSFLLILTREWILANQRRVRFRVGGGGGS